VNLVLNEEQEELQATVRRFLADRSPLSRVRQVMETPEGRDAALWERMAADLGLQGLTVPESYGGAGLGEVELSVVMEELGAALTPSPFLASAVLAATALLATDDEEARRDLLPGLAAGTTVATLAVAEDGRGWDVAATAASATLEDGRWVLDGVKTLVPDGVLADVVLVAARTGDELGLFAVEGGAPGLTRANLAGLDPTRRLARLELARTPAGQKNPILAGVTLFRSVGSLYKNSGLATDSEVLLTGTIPGHTEPVAWVRERKLDGGKTQRVFYTSLGHPDDFADPNFLRLVTNGLLWAAGRDVPAAR